LNMPVYEYVCRDCREGFEVRASVSEYQKGLAVRCPKCGSGRVGRSWTTVNLLTPKAENHAGGCGCGPSTCCG